MINDQYKVEFVDRLVNCKTITCNHIHYFMIISNYLFFDLLLMNSPSNRGDKRNVVISVYRSPDMGGSVYQAS